MENCRLANAIIAKKSEFSKDMQKEWLQKVMPVQKFMKMSRRPFKVEVIPKENQTFVEKKRHPSTSSRLHRSHLP
jgi:hypothetical protein